MARNRGTTLCDCGEQLELKHAFTRPLEFSEYLIIVGLAKGSYLNYPYYLEYAGLIGCGVKCPMCDTLYYFWIGGTHHVNGKNYPIRFGDTSYWETFNDEE